LLNARAAVLEKSPPRKIEISARKCDDGVLIGVCDNGGGIPPEIRQQIFEPFFTTRADRDGDAKGHGLGLAVCREIMGSLGGWIALESEPGRGTTFTLHLPA
jgi:signal transduction histidine kinase